MIYGYCLRRAGDPPPPPDLTGVDDMPVTLLEPGAIGLWCSENSTVSASVPRLRQHERVVRLALRTATPLPLRFGTFFGSAREAGEALSRGADKFLQGLERVAGRVEMGIRVTSAAAGKQLSAPLDLPTSGRAYLEARRRQIEHEENARQEATGVLHLLELGLDGLDAEVVVEPSPAPPLVGSMAYLLHRGHVRLFQERVRKLQAEHPELHFAVTGPWAPYSFVEG